MAARTSRPRLSSAGAANTFKGVVEQYKDTIDFFAASGVPLRASINLTLASQDVEFVSAKKRHGTGYRQHAQHRPGEPAAEHLATGRRRGAGRPARGAVDRVGQCIGQLALRW